MSSLVASALEKTFGNHSVLKKLNLDIPEGAIYGLLGRNGAGKTTLLNVAMGLLFPSGGEIRVLGRNPARSSPSERGQVGYVAEHGLVPPWMTIDQVIRFEKKLHPQFEAGRLQSLTARPGFPLARRIRELSKGQRRRLELELMLALRPKVIVLDEPFDGLDSVSRAEVVTSLLQHASEASATVILSSHVLSDLERICDRIGVLAGGKIAFEATLDALKESVCIVRGPPDLGPPGLGTVVGMRIEGDSKTWLLRGLERPEDSALEQVGFQVLRPSLEDLGLELIRCLDPEEGGR